VIPCPRHGVALPAQRFTARVLHVSTAILRRTRSRRGDRRFRKRNWHPSRIRPRVLPGQSCATASS
jgi:hypothetical protein